MVKKDDMPMMSKKQMKKKMGGGTHMMEFQGACKTKKKGKK